MRLKRGFFVFFRNKPNLAKSEIARIGVLKGVQVALCGMRYVDLNDDTLKTLSTHHTYDKN